MVLQSLSDCIYKRSQVKGAVPETVFVYQSYSFWLTALILVLLFETFPATWTAWKYGPICGVVAYSAYYAYLRSLKSGQVSVNTMIFRLSFVLTAFLAIVILGEAVTLRKLLGLASAALAALSLTVLPAWKFRRREPGSEAEPEKAGRGLAPALIAFGCLGLLVFIYKLAALEGVPAASVIFVQASFVSPIAMLNAAYLRRFVWHPASAAHGLAAGLLISMAIALLIGALFRGEAGVVVPINQMSFVLTAVLAAVWFRETWAAWKTAAVLLATGAVVLLSG